MLVGVAGLAPGGSVDEQAVLLTLDAGVVDPVRIPPAQDLFTQFALDRGVSGSPDEIVELQGVGAEVVHQIRMAVGVR